MHETNDLSALFPQQSPSPLPTSALALLDHERILSVSGADATRFLQGQLTCDVAALQPGDSTLGARCNPKGRMQSSFRLLKLSEQDYLLAMAAELLAAQQADLAKYAVFFKVQLTEASDQWLRLGLWGERLDAGLVAAGLDRESADATQGLAVPVSAAMLEIWLPASRAASATTALAAAAQPVTLNDWQLQLIRAGIGQVCSQTRDSFIPQMLNLQQLGGVSFRKGCYTGQEIVARMQYLGKLKRRMYRLTWTGDTLPEPATPILDSGSGQAVGEVVMAARGEQRIELLAVLQNEAAQSARLSLSNVTEPSLELATLPYEEQMAAEAAGE